MLQGTVISLLGLLVFGLSLVLHLDPKARKDYGPTAVWGFVGGTVIMIMGFWHIGKEVEDTYDLNDANILRLAVAYLLIGAFLRLGVYLTFQRTRRFSVWLHIWTLFAVMAGCAGVSALIIGFF